MAFNKEEIKAAGGSESVKPETRADVSVKLSEEEKVLVLDEGTKGNLIVAELEEEFSETSRPGENVGRSSTVAGTGILDSIESGVATGFFGETAKTPMKDGWSSEDIEDKYTDEGDVVKASKPSKLSKRLVSEELVVDTEKRDLDDDKNYAAGLNNTVSTGVFNGQDLSSNEIESNDGVMLESISVNAAGASRSNQKKRSKEKEEMDLPRLSRSLGDEQELIELLFTAM